jgi:N-acetylmuramoyl-L-alanine amidase
MSFALVPRTFARLVSVASRPLAIAAGLMTFPLAQTAEAQFWPFTSVAPAASVPAVVPVSPPVEEAVLEAPAMLGAKPRAVAVAAPPAEVATALAGDSNRTRFVIGLEKAAEFQVFSLSNPNRVIVELPDLKLQLPQISGSAPVGLVQSFRGGLSAPGKMRIVIDVTGPVVVEKATIEKAKDSAHSPRLVLEIVPVDAAKPAHASAKKAIAGGPSGLGAIGVQPPLPRLAQRPGANAANVYKPIIVIDPGHGGHDSGATRNGAIEKDVVLAFSLKLREKLQASGRYKVLMTRDNDSFVDLDDRRDFADRAKASLFIAVHADYAGSDARGATIYSLRDNVANELQRAARGGVSAEVLSNKELETVKTAAESDVGAVKGFLTDLALKELAVNKERTKSFAGAVVETMGATTSMMNNPDREASFRVLKSAKMPSVLIELAYVSNRADAANLKSDAWRDKVSGSIMTAVDNYFSYHGSRLPM